ncbi:MAG: 3-oxoacid CoA-transferase subunit B [Rhodospirillaceae bacterium]|jgi:3-oxoadipate CoA-transferase, beta subunit|nr:3-oxoacid CoA-transferase subunit B [Rhodospirillaceae bacterium]MBT5192389.1 3-oxoacid CoA-transferase subunit B [Rhodospirillaceae bacterium]MBT5897122.1 3-oxoacid CoA-transferase subunit B [Rhodospirillaceae bacterium]MBT6429908.1 3-oxoacid CoA-transferase subunit B [Rhodospirillaceae bacterium]MBT7756983.1 3-oxoacid CoA-transferase subunit B [Rhodospirillaceae bacterium]
MTAALSRDQMAWRAAQDLADGAYVNLGLGMPVLAASYAPDDRDIFFQSENGILGVGPLPAEGQGDRELVDAGSRVVTLRDGAAVFDSAASFAMIRGGHVDITILGAFQVAANGDLANWDAQVPNKGPLIGGAMDLAAGAKAVHVIMRHQTGDGGARLVEACTYPLTAAGIVKRVYTDLAVLDVGPDGFMVREIIPGLSRDDLAAATAAPLTFADDCRDLFAPDISVNKD